MFKKLREDYTYKNKLFVSYKPFYDFDESLESKCIKQEFFFESSLKKIDNSKGLIQDMVPCFARSALVKPDVSYDKYDYYYEFFIFPAGKDSLYVFKLIPNSVDIYLLERCKNIKWRNGEIAVNPELFTLPPPQIIEKFKSTFLLSLIDMDLLTMRYVLILWCVFIFHIRQRLQNF